MTVGRRGRARCRREFLDQRSGIGRDFDVVGSAVVKEHRHTRRADLVSANRYDAGKRDDDSAKPGDTGIGVLRCASPCSLASYFACTCSVGSSNVSDAQKLAHSAPLPAGAGTMCTALISHMPPPLQPQPHTAVAVSAGAELFRGVLAVHRDDERAGQRTVLVGQADGKLLAGAKGVGIPLGDQLEGEAQGPIAVSLASPLPTAPGSWRSARTSRGLSRRSGCGSLSARRRRRALLPSDTD